MKEILFRGKREDGVWLYGHYTDDTAYDADFPCIVPLRSYPEGNWAPALRLAQCGKEERLWSERSREAELSDEVAKSDSTRSVDKRTVGQYIGLTDRNGQKVFEGDILKSYWDEAYPEDFCYEVVLWYDNGWCIKQGTATPDRLDGVFKNDCLEYSEVVGNVYDNPELLEDGVGS